MLIGGLDESAIDNYMEGSLTLAGALAVRVAQVSLAGVGSPSPIVDIQSPPLCICLNFIETGIMNRSLDDASQATKFNDKG